MSFKQGPPPPPDPPHFAPLSSDAPSTIAQPYVSLPDNRFTWEAIWSFFMRAPRIRSWLFQNEAPPAKHVVQSLLSGPILTGYIFGSYSERVPSYSFPDIGDLQTVFCSDGDALLGFHFGFQGVQPVMPLIFEVAKDPCLGNPNVVVRRTARQKAPIPGLNCYLAIEFNWFQSGALSVSTSVNPIDPSDRPPSGLRAFFENAEIRVFKPATAERFLKVAQLYREGLDFGHFPHTSNFKKLPDDFLDPPDDYYTLTISEPVDPVYRSTLTPAYIKADQPFHVQNEFPNVANNSTTQTPIGGAALHCDRGDVSSVTSQRTVALWNDFQKAVAHSRRTGLLTTMCAKKVGGRFGKVISLFGRDVRYTFLSTLGLNVHGRIQRLCNQLGIMYSSPLPDTKLMSTISFDDETFGNSRVHYDGTSRHNVVKELDLTKSDLPRLESSKRKTSPPQTYHEAPRARGSGELEGVYSRASLSSHGSVPSISFHSTEESLPPSISQSASTDRRTSSFSDHDSPSESRSRNPKRRRYSPTSSIRTMDPHDERIERANLPGRTDLKQEPIKAHVPVYPVKSENQEFHQTQIYAPAVVQDMKRADLADRTHVRRRSFEITDMLSDEVKVYPNQHSTPASEAFSSTHEGSFSQTPSSTVSAPDYRKSEICQGSEVSVEYKKTKEENSQGKPATQAKKGNGTVWTCDRCGVQIRGKKGNLNRHIANKHDNIRAYVCNVPICGRKFQTRLNLLRHERAVHLGRPFTCSSCPRAFKYEEDLKAHMKSAHENAESTLACDICGSCFGRRSTLNRHKAKVHKVSEQRATVS